MRVLLVHSPSQQSVLRGYDEFDEFVVRHMRASGLPFLEMRPIVQENLADGIYHDDAHLEVDGQIHYGNAIAEAISALLIGSN